jgi:DNA-directed RNA polymerase subunit RPC12/RpoP
MSAKLKKAKCPKCAQAFSFELLPDMTSVVCPHCEASIEFRRKPRPQPTATAAEAPTSPSSHKLSTGEPTKLVADSPQPRKTTPKEPQPESPPANPSEPPEPTFNHKPLDSLLPPTFDLGEQSSGVGPRGNQSQVILPTSDGGLQQIDTNTVTIKHGGKSVTLIASTPRERARRRFLENTIAMVLAIGIIALAMWILR